MLKRYRLWVGANPLWDWFLTVAVLSGVVSLFSLIPGRRHDNFDFVLVGIVLASPTTQLIQRFSLEERQARPVPTLQERGVVILAALALLCSVTALSLGIAGRHLGWAVNTNVQMLMVFSISALLSLGLAYAVRHTTGGQWVLRLVLSWFALIVLAIIVGLLRQLLTGS